LKARSKYFNDRAKKEEAYDMLFAEVKTIDRDADCGAIVKQRIVLKGHFRNE
jgi:hypothetical protein